MAAATAATRLVSEDGTHAVVQVQFDDNAQSVPVDDRAQIPATADAALAAAGLTASYSVEITQDTSLIGPGEVLGLTVALVVLVITLGSLIAAGLPLLVALLGVGVGLAGAVAFTVFTDLNTMTPSLALMLGLAVGIDYALFIVNRHRGNILRGDGPARVDRALGRDRRQRRRLRRHHRRHRPRRARALRPADPGPDGSGRRGHRRDHRRRGRHGEPGGAGADEDPRGLQARLARPRLRRPRRRVEPHGHRRGARGGARRLVRRGSSPAARGSPSSPSSRCSASPRSRSARSSSAWPTVAARRPAPAPTRPTRRSPTSSAPASTARSSPSPPCPSRTPPAPTPRCSPPRPPSRPT